MPANEDANKDSEDGNESSAEPSTPAVVGSTHISVTKWLDPQWRNQSETEETDSANTIRAECVVEQQAIPAPKVDAVGSNDDLDGSTATASTPKPKGVNVSFDVSLALV